MPAGVPFHLGRGDTGPLQQSPVTCGSASLTVARMLVSPEFAGWIVDGIDPRGGPTDPRPQAERFADHERTVMSRTNGLHAADGRLNFPWPHSLGTPPWGAAKELESSQLGMTGAAYSMRVLGFGSGTTLREAHRVLIGLVREGLPALLYIGNRWMPRHVTLVLPGDRHEGDGQDGDGVLDVYDPATGAVTDLDPEQFATRTLGIAGWNVPWITVQPARDLLALLPQDHRSPG